MATNQDITWVEKILKKPHIIISFLALFIFMGLGGFNKIHRNLFPNSNYPEVAVVVVEPGASAKSMASNIAVAVEEEIPSGRIIDPEEKKLATAEHNMTQVMCIVTDHQTGITVEEAGVSPVYRMSWGNKLGSVSVTVRLDGRPQYLHIATIRRLREVVNPFVGKDENGKETSKLGDKRFTVTIVDGWTQEQIDAKVKQQAARG